jgi:hypothetical protein
MLANLSGTSGTIRAVSRLEVPDMFAFQTLHDKPLARALVSVDILSYRLIPKQVKASKSQHYKDSPVVYRELYAPPDFLTLPLYAFSNCQPNPLLALVSPSSAYHNHNQPCASSKHFRYTPFPFLYLACHPSNFRRRSWSPGTSIGCPRPTLPRS